MRVGDLQFISGESVRTFLIGAVPIWERAALDVTGKSLFCLVAVRHVVEPRAVRGLQADWLLVSQFRCGSGARHIFL